MSTFSFVDDMDDYIYAGRKKEKTERRKGKGI